MEKIIDFQTTVEEIQEIKSTLQEIIKTKFNKKVTIEYGLRWPDESTSMWFYIKTIDGRNLWIGAYRETCIHYVENVLYYLPKDIVVE